MFLFSDMSGTVSTGQFLYPTDGLPCLCFLCWCLLPRLYKVSDLNLLLIYLTKSNIYCSQLKHLLGISIPTISGPGRLVGSLLTYLMLILNLLCIEQLKVLLTSPDLHLQCLRGEPRRCQFGEKLKFPMEFL